jgi:hypothetical protein
VYQRSLPYPRMGVFSCRFFFRVLPTLLAFGPQFYSVPALHISCPAVVPALGHGIAELDIAYYGMMACVCDEGYYGFNGTCVLCPASCVCSGTLISGCYPTSKAAAAPGSGVVVGVTECLQPSQGLASSCNPHRKQVFECSTGSAQDSLLCSECIPGWFHDGLSCKRCLVWNRLLAPLVLVGYFVGMCTKLWLQWPKDAAKAPSPSAPVTGVAPSPPPSATLEIVVNYVLTVNAFVTSGRWIQVWTSAASEGVTSATNLFSFGFGALQCIFDVPAWRLSFVLTILAPVVFAAIVGAHASGWAIRWAEVGRALSRTLTRRGAPVGSSGALVHWSPDLYDRSLSVLLSLLDFWYLKCATAVFSMWTCTIHDPVTGSSVLHLMPWLDCSTVRAWIPVTVGAALLYVAGIPAVVTAVIRRYRHDLDAPVVLRRYSMFLKHTRPGCYWWAVSQYSYKVAVAAATTLVPPHKPALYFVLMIFILQFQFAALLSAQPYNSRYDNRLSLFTVFGPLSAASTGLYVTATGDAARTGDVIAVQSLAVLVNLAVAGVVALAMWRAVVQPLVVKLWGMARRVVQGALHRPRVHADDMASIPLTCSTVTAYSSL